MYFCALYLCAFSSARVVDSSTEASSLCIDGPLCASRGSSSLSRLTESLPKDTCPKFIIEQQVLRDQKISLTTDSPDEICSTSTVNNLNHFKDAAELESYLKQNPFFAELNKKSGSTLPDFSSCLSQRVSVPVGLGKTALALSTKALPESKKKLAVAEYYSSLRRLSDGVERSLQNITAIDLMIGEESLLEDISCNSFDPLSGEVKSQCRSVKQCPVNNNSQLRESSKDTLLALQAIEAIDKEIKRIKFMANPVSFEGSGGVSGTSKKKIEELEERKKNLQNLYPWIVGKVFKDTYDRDDYSNYAESSEEKKSKMENQIAGLIKDQLTHTREKLKERKEDFIKASSCIKGDEDLCNQLDMAKVLAKTPPINHDEVFERDRKKELKRRYEHEENLSPEERKEYREFLTTEEKREYRDLLTKVGEADGLFELAGCLQTQRKAVKEVSRELALGALDLGIVIGTMGLGSPYVAGRLAVRLGSTVSKATQAKNLSKAKRLQSLGIFGTDVSFSSPYMQEAMETCEDTLNQLEEMQTEEQTANAEKNNKLCENLPIRAKQTSDLKSCILQASLASLPITLPILGLSGVALAKQLRNTPTGTPTPLGSSTQQTAEIVELPSSQTEIPTNPPAPPISSAQQTAEVLEFPSPQKGISINSSGASSDEAVSFSVSEMNTVNRRMSRIQRRAGRELEEALQKIRNSPQEPVLKAQGFKPTYYRGLDQAREFNEVAKYLRTINADSEKTHIPYFADQVGKTITDFEKGLRQHNKNKLKFLGERLEILEELKKEARRRVEDQNVTYDWWSTFTLRLSMIASEPDSFMRDILHLQNMDRLDDPAERVEAGIEIAYNKKLVEKIKDRVNNIFKSKLPQSSLQAKFEQLNPEEILFEGKHTSRELERILKAISSYTHPLDTIVEERISIFAPVQTYERTQEFLLLDNLSSPAFSKSKYSDIVSFIQAKNSFPEEVMFFTTDELGIMAFNKLEDNSHFVGLSGKPLLADGLTWDALEFFTHDVSHMINNEGKVHPKIVKRISNISNRLDREKAELALFMYSHEGEGKNFNNLVLKTSKLGAKTNLSLSKLRQLTIDIKESAQNMMTENSYRFLDSDDLQGMLPDSVNVNDEEAVEKFLMETADVLADILLAH